MNTQSPLSVRLASKSVAQRIRWLGHGQLAAAVLLLGYLLGISLFGRFGPQTAMVVLLAVLAIAGLYGVQQSQRRAFIREAPLPKHLVAKIIAAHSQLTERDADLVMRGLRQFFIAFSRSQHRAIGMPSKAVDTAWHEFILHTKAYEQWCQAAFGRMLHHTPAEAMQRSGSMSAQRNDGLRRTWFWACKEESIDPRAPMRLPLLFALDAKFNIEGGYRYVANCEAIRRSSDTEIYCGTDFAKTKESADGGSGCGGYSGDGDGLGGSDGGGADGGGCGGD